MMTELHEICHRHAGIVTRLQAVADGIIRVTRTRREDFLTTSSPVVVCDGQGSAVLTETEAAYWFQAEGAVVRCNKDTGALVFTDTQGSVLLREPDRRPALLTDKPVLVHRYDDDTKVTEGNSVDGVRASAEPAHTYVDRTAYECRQNFVFDADEGLYGLGSHEEGYGSLRGKSQMLYQHNMKAVVPVLVSTKGWGILFDMGCLMAFHDDEQGSYLWADAADELDWYFFYGDGSYASAMNKLRLLTGETPMLPKYALGYIQSKERYVDAQELLSVTSEYRRRHVPLDMIVLDWCSWPDGQWGWPRFDEKRFPDPKALTQQLHEMDCRLMVSIWPSMQGEHNADRLEMLQNGCMLGNKLNYNALDPKARALYWKQANENLFRHGVDAWWCDCTEPFEADWRGAIKPEPLVRAHLNTDEAKRYLDPSKINLYSLYHSQGIYEGQRSVTSDKRVCNLTRSSYAGQHRYATITWSGDVSANWETLRRHVPEGLNFCATGEGYWSTDIGAFFPNGNWEPWFYEGDFDGGMADLGYRELFVRWAQYAAFLPMMRAHGTGTPREIWRLGEQGEPFYDAMLKAIRLRYHLLPYLYALTAELHRAGIPMLRVPALVFPEDKHLRNVNDQMMLGDILLIKPVTRPMYYQPESQPISCPDERVPVYLPAGHMWYDLVHGHCHQGGQLLEVHAPLDEIPMFVRSGAILPWGADVEYAAQLRDKPLEIIVCPGEDGTFYFYDDAGDGYGYEQGEYSCIPMQWRDKEKQLVIGDRQGSYPGMPEELQLRVHMPGSKTFDVPYRGKALVLTICQ